MTDVTLRTNCRVCRSTRLTRILSLGSTPPANAFLKPEELSLPEETFPLELDFCEECSFVQLRHVVSPELLFRNYVYVSSTSPTFVAHFKELAGMLHRRFELPREAQVVDIGSNDGVFLKPFKELGMRVLGVDPAVKIAEQATRDGIETLPHFFTPDLALEIVRTRGNAQLVTATSVFPHVDDLDNLVAGVKTLLTPDGVFVIEAYYLLDLIKKNLFDTIYHEHLSYFTVKTISALFERLEMEVFDVEHTDTHGGSLRVFVQKQGGGHTREASLEQFMKLEDAAGLYHVDTFRLFNTRIEANKRALVDMLRSLKQSGKRIVGYGAPAKGNTLLNYFGIGLDVLDYIVDDSPWKQGLLTPGTHIPVVSSAKLSEDKPDYVLILAWNFAEQIMARYADRSFIIPVPQPVVINDIVDQDLYTISESLHNEVHELEGKTLLITGGSGFLGSYIVATIDFLNRFFFERPCRVISIDNHLVGKKNNLLHEVTSDHITFREHDVCVPFTIDEPIDYIVNAAGVASPVYYKRYPIETIEGTIFGLKNALELARHKQVKGILYFSSSEIYGDPDPNFIPTPETYKGNVSSIGPRSCYDESKRLGETLALAYYTVHKVPIKMVRPFNVYGPGMSSKDYRVMPTFLSQGIVGKTLTVHDRGNQTRTFCYVTDAIIGFLLVLLKGRSGEVYNIGNDNDEINMLGLAETVNKAVFGGKVGIELVRYPDQYPQDEPRRRCPDLTKAKTEFNYHARVNLETGIKRSYHWFMENEWDHLLSI